MEEYIEDMIEQGYLRKSTLEPIRCVYCNGKELEDIDFIQTELGTYIITEFKRVCTECDKEVGYWSYGQWQI